VIAGTFDTPDYAYGIWVVDTLAYVADRNDGLRIINVANPASPFAVGAFDTPNQSMGVFVAGSYAHVADAGSGLRIINVGNPASPYQAAYYDTPWSAYGCCVANGYVYVADWGCGLQIYAATLGIQEPEVGGQGSGARGLAVFPNPARANSDLRITIDESVSGIGHSLSPKVRLYTAAGALVAQQDVTGNAFRMTLRGRRPGVYLMRVGTQSTKLVVAEH